MSCRGTFKTPSKCSLYLSKTSSSLTSRLPSLSLMVVMFLLCPAIFLMSWYRSPLQLFLAAVSASYAKLFSLLRLSARARYYSVLIRCFKLLVVFFIVIINIQFLYNIQLFANNHIIQLLVANRLLINYLSIYCTCDQDKRTCPQLASFRRTNQKLKKNALSVVNRY